MKQSIRWGGDRAYLTLSAIALMLLTLASIQLREVNQQNVQLRQRLSDMRQAVSETTLMEDARFHEKQIAEGNQREQFEEERERVITEVFKLATQSSRLNAPGPKAARFWRGVASQEHKENARLRDELERAYSEQTDLRVLLLAEKQKRRE